MKIMMKLFSVTINVKCDLISLCRTMKCTDKLNRRQVANNKLDFI